MEMSDAQDSETPKPKDRRFYSLPEDKHSHSNLEVTNSEHLLKYISHNIIGKDKIFSGPFGLRRVTYLDYIASGRALNFIEDYIKQEVLPDYGNTHTTSSITSLQTTLYRHEARDIVRNSVHASEHDSVIFCGSGTTEAVHKLIHALHLSEPPVVFVSPYEHHSNLLPWKEIGSKVIRIGASLDGLIDLKDLDNKLQKWKICQRQMIGCFSAASNITGILVDVDAVTICLHRHGALAFWDYATAAPYVKIDVNPVTSNSEDQPYIYKDAVFMSPHKFIGGVSTPGILVAKKRLFKNMVPDKCGGGSVFFVRRDEHRYLKEPELKEESGTPAIVESIRAGLVFQLKDAVTPEKIMEIEHELFRKAKEAWHNLPNLVLLGNMDVQRLPVFSFLIYHKQSGRFLHHNYVTVLLNDLFGIQARGGCACAGPYAMDVLGLDEKTASEIENLLIEDERLDRTHLRRYREYSQREIIRPGFVRINLPYFMEEDTLQFVFEAVRRVAEHGWKLLPQYMFNPETGEWRQKDFKVFKDRKWLGHISYSSGEMKYTVPPPVVKGPLPTDYQDCLHKAKLLFIKSEKTRYQLPDHTQMFDDHSQPYRWFLLPSEAATCLHGDSINNFSHKLPFCPPQFREFINLPAFKAGGYIDDTDNPNEFISIHASDVSLHLDSGRNVQGDRFDEENISGCAGGGQSNKCMKGGKCKERKGHKDSANISSLSCSYKSDLNNKTSTVLHSSDLDVSINIDGEITKESAESCANYKMVTDDLDSCNVSKKRKLEDDMPSNNDNLSGSHDNMSSNSDNMFGYHGNVSGNHGNISITSDSMSGKNVNISSSNLSDNHGNISGNHDKQGKSELDIKDKSTYSTERESNTKQKTKPQRVCKWYSPPKCIFKPFLNAVEDHSMIKDTDKVLVCLSGGKDSLSLLHTIRQYQFYCRSKGIKFDFGAVTVDPQTPSYDPSSLKDYLASLNVPYFYESQGIMESAMKLDYECASICSFCSRMKRGRIYACARREGYNVLALGQHLDDLCESFMMSLFHNGILRTMKAHYTVQEGDLRVIRPFAYVREKDLRTFAEKNKLPVIAENCPACFEAPKERHRTKQLLAAQEIMFPNIFNSMMSAIKPIMAINRTGVNVAEVLRGGSKQPDDDMDM